MSIDARATPSPAVTSDAEGPGERAARLRPVVFASVGTDHHEFNRLVEWMDEWQAGRGPRVSSGEAVACRVVVQYGTSRAPSVAGGSALMAHADLEATMAGAVAIVTHGGPATIRDARSAGLRPLVVPRDPAFGEHVDDHQIRFTRMLAERGEVVLCRQRAELFSALDRAIDDSSWLHLADDSRSEETAEAVRRVGDILDDVIRTKRSGRSFLQPRRRGGP